MTDVKKAPGEAGTVELKEDQVQEVSGGAYQKFKHWIDDVVSPTPGKKEVSPLSSKA